MPPPFRKFLKISIDNLQAFRHAINSNSDYLRGIFSCIQICIHTMMSIHNQ